MRKVRLVAVCVWAVWASLGAAWATESGSIVGWGYGRYGVDLSGGFTAVAAGFQHSLGLKADGSIVAWGDNACGQCDVPSPNEGFIAVAAAWFSSLGLKRDGSIVAWPESVGGPPAPNTGFVGIATSGGHNLGLKEDGSIVAWKCGWVENVDDVCDVPEPNTGFVAVAVGGGRNVGLKADGSIVLWGITDSWVWSAPEPNRDFVAISTSAELALKRDGSIVALGDTTGLPSFLPEPNTGFVGISGTAHSGVGIKANGSLVTWGTYSPYLPVPNTDFVAVASQNCHALGLKADGSIVPMGANDYGQCNIPEPNADFVSVGTGGQHGLGLKADGSFRSWGSYDTDFGPLPDPNTGFVAIAMNGGHYAGLKDDGSIEAWGFNDSMGLPSAPRGTGFMAVAAGMEHGLGLKADGSIVVWGGHFHNQNTVPWPNTSFAGVGAGLYHCLGVKTDGSVVAWGENGSGQCNVPLPNTGFVAVSGGDEHSLGLKADGSVVAWGSNEKGQCNVPKPNWGFIAVAAGDYHSLGLKADGAIVAWGDNEFGVCDVPSPNTGFIAVAAGWRSSAGIRRKAELPVPIPITLGERVAGTARPNHSTDYRLELQAGQAPHLLVRVYPLSECGTWMLRGYQGTPTAPEYKWAGQPINDKGVIEMLIPSPIAGTYFFSLCPYLGGANTPQPFEIEVLAVERHVGRLSSVRGSNTGTTTFQLLGLGFEPGVRVELRDAGNTVLAAQMMQILTDRVTGQFNLTGVAPGVYDVVVVWPSGDEEILPGAFEVVPGSGPRLEARVTGPPEVRAGRTYTAWVEYWNAGDSDLITPLLYLSNTQGIEMRAPGTGRVSHTALALLGVAKEKPLGVLAPGAHNFIPVSFVAPSTGECRFKLHAVQASVYPVDWAALEPLLRPCCVTDAEWAAYWEPVTNGLGTTWAQLLGGVSAVLNRDVTNTYDTSSLRLFDFANVLSNASGEIVVPSPALPESGQTWNPDTHVTVTPVGTFDPARSRSFVVSHGSNASKDEPSIAALGQALAGCGDSNVLVVDWHKGAAGTAWGAARRAVEAGPAAAAALRAFVVGHGADASFWGTVTYIGCGEGNVVNKAMAEAEGRVGKGLILDPAYQWGGAPPAFAAAYSKSVSIGSIGLMDANPCSPLVQGELADVQYLLEGVFPTAEDPLMHRAALRALVERLQATGGCNDAWLSLDLPAAREGATGFDGVTQLLDAPVAGLVACASGEPIDWLGGYLADFVFTVVRPVEPNEKTGPVGTGSPETERFVQPGDELPYVVYFENKCTASVPAQEVVVTDDLDADLDWGSFRLTEIAWGDHRVNIPPDTSHFYSRETVPDPRPGVEKTWWVDVSVDLNLATGRVQWTFRTLDPDTGELPEDVHAGFLPPNAIDGVCVPEDRQGPGEAHVAYTVRAQSGLPSWTCITNTATIAFDTEAPIVTNEVFNIIPEQPAAVPSVVGLTQENAQAALVSAGLSMGVLTMEYSATVARGLVIRQDPASGVLLLGAAVSLVVSRGPQPVAVPNVVGMLRADALAAIEAAGLALGAVTIQDQPGAAPGVVLSQDPASGNLLPGGEVDLVVSKAAGPVRVPEVAWLPLAQAEAAIRAAGLVVGSVTEEFSATVAAGVVLSQDPSGTLLPGSAVNLVVSKGPYTVGIPNVVGMTRGEAEGAIAAAGLTVGSVVVEYSETVPAGVVFGQNPAGGLQVVPGSAVSLVVSSRNACDLNRSGAVTATDIQLVINAALGRTVGTAYADVDGDNRVNATDVQMVISAALGKI